MPASNSTLLVTTDELADYARSTVRGFDDDPVRGQNALRAAQDALERFLGRPLFVVQRLEPWCTSGYVRIIDGTGYSSKPYHWCRAFPVVEVDTADVSRYTYEEGAPGSASGVRRLYADSAPGVGVVTYYAGYRSSDHVLSGGSGDEVNLQDLTGLSGLGTLPDLVPPDIHAAICEAAILIDTTVAQGAIGTTETVESVGTATTTTRGVHASDVNRLIGRGGPLEMLFTKWLPRPVGIS